MKAKMIFDLTDSDDRLDFIRAVKAADMAYALWDYDQELRNKVKHSEVGAEAEWAEKFREMFREILSENNINLDELNV